jgi:hypothetical protein
MELWARPGESGRTSEWSWVDDGECVCGWVFTKHDEIMNLM